MTRTLQHALLTVVVAAMVVLVVTPGVYLVTRTLSGYIAGFVGG